MKENKEEDHERDRGAEIEEEGEDLVQDREVDLEAMIEIAEEAADVIDPEVYQEPVIDLEAEIGQEVATDDVEGVLDLVLSLGSAKDLSKKVASEQKHALLRILLYLPRRQELELLQHQNESTARLHPAHLLIPQHQIAMMVFDVLGKHRVGLESVQLHQLCSKGQQNQRKR